jgi:hypothetical protein
VVATLLLVLPCVFFAIIHSPGSRGRYRGRSGIACQFSAVTAEDSYSRTQGLRSGPLEDLIFLRGEPPYSRGRSMQPDDEPS